MREVLLASKNKSLSECLQSTSLRTESWIRNQHVSLDTGVETGPLVKGRKRGERGTRGLEAGRE